MSSKSEDNAEVEVDKSLEDEENPIQQADTQSTGKNLEAVQNDVDKSLKEIDKEYENIVNENEDQGVSNMTEYSKLSEKEKSQYGL